MRTACFSTLANQQWPHRRLNLVRLPSQQAANRAGGAFLRVMKADLFSKNSEQCSPRSTKHLKRYLSIASADAAPGTEYGTFKDQILPDSGCPHQRCRGVQSKRHQPYLATRICIVCFGVYRLIDADHSPFFEIRIGTARCPSFVTAARRPFPVSKETSCSAEGPPMRTATVSFFCAILDSVPSWQVCWQTG